MKTHYIKPVIQVITLDTTAILAESFPYGPNSELIDISGEGGDEVVAPPPSSRARGMWGEW